MQHVHIHTCIKQQQWKESEQKAKAYERMRRTSFKMAREMSAKSPDMPEKILEQIPTEKQKEISRRMTARQKPSRYVSSYYSTSEKCTVSYT